MKKIFKLKITWIIIALLAVGGIYYFTTSKAKTITTTSKKETVHTVKRETLEETLTISGTIDADEKATLRFQNSGKLIWIGVKEGDAVKKYQAIASLDQQELQKNLQKYLYSYDKTRLDFDQTKDEYQQPAQKYNSLTWDQRNAVDRAYQKAQYDLNNAVLDVELKNIALQYATLISPIDGIITRIGTPVAGTNITPTQAEFDIVNPSTLYVSVLADQTEVTKFNSSMSAELVFDAFPDKTVTGMVRSIAFVPKEGETGTVYEIKISLPDTELSSHQYRLGMTGDATFVLAKKTDVLAVPATFIKTEAKTNKKYVLRKNGDRKQITYVSLGMETDTMTEITGGLAEGDVLYD